MPYSRQRPVWRDLPDTSTPLRAADLDGMETGIAVATSTAETAQSEAASSASSAAASAALVGAPADTIMATAVNGPGTATQAAVDNRIKPSSAKNPLTGWFHADTFGAAGDLTGNDATAIQAAINAAEAIGGGVVYVPEKYQITAGLLLPSNVTLRGGNSGGQPGASGAYSQIVYAGSAGGTVISPKVRTSDTVNWGLHGLRIDGGGLAAIVVELYRVSYSRLQDLSIIGGQASTGIGVLFDANVSNQCYFNVADGVKVDGLPVGVRFQRGANANRWQGGKIGNGETGMEFLSVSSGNIVVATDFENASVRHVYMDAGANVFFGVHMEVAPIGFAGTANAAGWHHSGSTIASTVTDPYGSDLSTVGSGLDQVTTDTYELRVGGTRLKSKTLSTSTQVTLDPAPFSSTASVLVNLFRNITTSGSRQLNIYKGDGTGTRQFLIDFGTATLSVGDVGVGGGVGGIGIANRATAPATNPAAGGFLYAEFGALRYKTSSGTVSTVAGDVVSKSANYTATTADGFILATGGASGITVTLPSATQGAQYVVKKIDAGAGAVTVATTSSQTIDGATTKVLSSQWASVRVVSDGTAWFVVG